MFRNFPTQEVLYLNPYYGNVPINSVTRELSFDDDSGNGDSTSPGDSPQKADEATAILERLTAEEKSRQEVSIPDAWADDARTGHETRPVDNQSVYYDQSAYAHSVYNQSALGQRPPDQSLYNQSGHQQQCIYDQRQSVYNQTGQLNSRQIYDIPAQKQLFYDAPQREQAPYDLSRTATDFDHSQNPRGGYEHAEAKQPGHETSGAGQCVNVELSGATQTSTRANECLGTGYQILVLPSVEANEDQKPGKRKFCVGNETTCQGYLLTAEEVECLEDGSKPKKIPRPPNAFMLYANEYRRILAKENPNESNKEISIRLGSMWKTMPKPVKESYFAMARIVDAEHKKKYPNYVYNPKEARMRKAIREQTREHNRSGGNGKSPSPSKRPSSVSSQGSSKSSMGGSVQRVLHDKKGGYMPMYPQPWGDVGGGGGGGGGQQYVVPDAYMDVSAAYQSHHGESPSNAMYANMMPSSWYPYYMQQENGAAYGQSWQQPHYLQQQHQRMQQMHQMQAQAAAAAHGASAQSGHGAGYSMMSFDAPAQQNVPAKPPGPQKPAKPTQDSTNSQPPPKPPSAEPSAAATRPSQEQATSTPLMSPTKAYHKYLQGNELSPPTSWPSLFMYPTPVKNSAGNSKQSKSGQDKTFGFYPSEVALPQFTYYDYIVPSVDFRGDMHSGPYPTGAFVNQVFPQTGVPDYPMAMGFHPMVPRRTQLKAESDSGDREFTMMVNVLDSKSAGSSGARVIATYDGENAGAKDGASLKGLKALELEEDPMKINDSDVGLENCTFSFMQDPMYKSILKSIEPADEDKRGRRVKGERSTVLPDLVDLVSPERSTIKGSHNDKG